MYPVGVVESGPNNTFDDRTGGTQVRRREGVPQTVLRTLLYSLKCGEEIKVTEGQGESEVRFMYPSDVRLS